MTQGVKINKKQWDKIFEVLKPKFRLGMSINEAIKASKLKRSSIYDYIKADDKKGGTLRIEIEGLQSMLDLKVRENLARDVDPKLDLELENEGVVKGSREASQWWAERKMKKEFSTRVENINADITPEDNGELSDAQAKNVNKALDLIGGDFLEVYDNEKEKKE